MERTKDGANNTEYNPEQSKDENSEHKKDDDSDDNNNDGDGTHQKQRMMTSTLANKLRQSQEWTRKYQEWVAPRKKSQEWMIPREPQE